MKKIQISFGKDADLIEVKRQLEMVKEFYEGQDVEFIHCFLPRKVVESKGWSTEICDLLDEVLGDKHVTALEQYDTLEDCMKNLPTHRDIVSRMVNKMYVLGEKVNSGIITEMYLFTNEKLVVVEWGAKFVR